MMFGNLELSDWEKMRFPQLNDMEYHARFYSKHTVAIVVGYIDNESIWTVDFIEELEYLHRLWNSQKLPILYQKEYPIEKVKELADQFLIRMSSLSIFI